MWKRASTAALRFTSFVPAGAASALKSKWTSRNSKRTWRTRTRKAHDQAAYGGEPMAEADRGRHPGSPRFNVLAGGPASERGRSALVVGGVWSLRMSIFSRFFGKPESDDEPGELVAGPNTDDSPALQLLFAGGLKLE